MLSATNWQISNSETECKNPSPNTHCGMPGLPSLLSCTGEGYSTLTGSPGKTFFPEHCGSAISVTQLQHLPRSLHHVTRCEAFHGNSGSQASLRGPIPERPAAKRCSSQPPPASPTSTGIVAAILHLFCSFGPVRLSLTLP